MITRTSGSADPTSGDRAPPRRAGPAANAGSVRSCSPRGHYWDGRVRAIVHRLAAMPKLPPRGRWCQSRQWLPRTRSATLCSTTNHFAQTRKYKRGDRAAMAVIVRRVPGDRCRRRSPLLPPGSIKRRAVVPANPTAPQSLASPEGYPVAVEGKRTVAVTCPSGEPE